MPKPASGSRRRWIPQVPPSILLKKKECLDWVEQNWTDMRPKSLIEAMNKKSQEHDEEITIDVV